MRVIVLNDHAWPVGGADQIALRSAEGLARRGHEVHFIGGARRGADDLGPEGCILHALSEQPIAEARGRAALRGIWNRRSADLLADVWRGDPGSETVVHIHNWTKLLTSSVIRRALALGAPTFLSMHDYDITCPNGGFYDYQSRSICLRTPLGVACTARHCDKKSYAQKIWRLARAHVQRTIGRAHDPRIRFVSVTDFAREIQARHLPHECRIDVVENPVLVIRKSVRAAASEPPSYVLYAGRLSPEKGPELLAEAAHAAGIPCVFAGEGPLLSRLRADFPSHDYRGHVERDALMTLMSEAVAVVVPSRWYETQSLVAWEAAALGVPVLAAEGTAPGQFVHETGCGRVFRRGDAASLRSEIESMWRDPAMARRLGDVGRRFIRQRERGLEAHVLALESRYADAVASLKRKRRREGETE